MILIRTQTVDEHLTEFARQLQGWSGLPVAYIVDERNGPAPVPQGALKVGLSREACTALSLYCTVDFAWRCGDYGLYLARKAFPDVENFWLIESDVRIAGTQPESFFAFFADREEEFLTSYIEPVSRDWYWYPATVSRDRPVRKCFFPVCRFSSRAIDRLLAARQHQSRQWSRRHFWPNDEAFVATALLGDGVSSGDFNAFGKRFYEESEFHFETVADGDEAVMSDQPARLFHPVLYGDAVAAKRARLAQRQERPSLPVRIAAKLDRKIGPSALAYRLNRSREWCK